MTTRSNDHLEKAYQSGHATNHHEGLRAVYQLGRADEAAALAPKLEIVAEPDLASIQYEQESVIEVAPGLQEHIENAPEPEIVLKDNPDAEGATTAL